MEDIILKHGDKTLDELQHWGIKGMKWGQRRFQNKDGSLTPAGEKRYNKEMERLEKQKGKIADANAKKAKMEALQKEIEDMKSGKITGNENKPKSAKEMSDDELRKAKNRLDMERDYQRAYEQANPGEAKKNSAVAENAKDFWDRSIKPALMESGKSLLTDFMKDQGKKVLGLDKDPPPGSVEAFKKAFDKIKYQADIAENAARKAAYDNALKDPDSIYLKEKGDKTVIGLKKDEANNSGNKEKPEDSFKRKAEKNTEKKVNDSYSDGLDYDTSDYEWTTNKKSKSSNTSKTDDDIPTWTGTVEGEGTSRAGGGQKGKKWGKRSKSKEDDIIDGYGEWVDEPISGVPATTRTNGQNIVTRLLDDRYVKHSDITLDDIEELVHHGIKGQKWGVRRYQNQNGSLTPEGKEHRDKREGRNKYRVKDSSTVNKSENKKPNIDESKIFSEFKSKIGDLYEGDIKSEDFRNLTKQYNDLSNGSSATQKLKADYDNALKNKKRELLSKEANKRFSDIRYDKDTDTYKAKNSFGKTKLVEISERAKQDPNIVKIAKELDKQQKSDRDVVHKKRMELLDNMASVALKELGYEDNITNREYMSDFIESLRD